MIREITSKDNNKIKNVVKLVTDKKLRKKEGLFVGEGVVNLKEATSSGAVITEIYFSFCFSIIRHNFSFFFLFFFESPVNQAGRDFLLDV